MKNLNKETFEQTISDKNTPVLVDFWADWCGPCKMLGPVIEELDKEMTDVTFAKVNVDEENELAASFQVMSIPTVLLFNQGECVAKSVGYKSKDEMKTFIENALK